MVRAKRSRGRYFRMSSLARIPLETAMLKILLIVLVDLLKAFAMWACWYPSLRSLIMATFSFLRIGILAKTLFVDLTLFANRLRYNLFFLF